MNTETARYIAALQYDKTRERLTGTEPYDAMKAAADAEEASGERSFFRRNRLAFYIETQTPFIDA